jgi:hypothetical protein
MKIKKEITKFLMKLIFKFSNNTQINLVQIKVEVKFYH